MQQAAKQCDISECSYHNYSILKRESDEIKLLAKYRVHKKGKINVMQKALQNFNCYVICYNCQFCQY